MNNILTANLVFINNKGKSIQYPIQGQHFKLVLRLSNNSDSVVTNFLPSEAYLSHVSNQSLMQGISFTSNGPVSIPPNESVQFETIQFRTFHKNICTINIKFISRNPVNIVLDTPLEKNLVPSKENYIFAQLFIQDKDEDQNKKLALSNTILSFISCAMSILAISIALFN